MKRPAYLASLIFTLATSGLVARQYTPPKLPTEGKFPSDKIIKITDAGATADDKTLSSDAIAKAIDQCAAAGGGIVRIPNTGLYKQTGTADP